MTNEQREAIELLERIHASYFLSGMIEQSNYIVDKAYETDKAIDTVLSLIKEQQIYIKKYNDTTEEMNRDIRKLISEIQKKDKQIDLMAEIFYKRFKAELLLEYGFENEEQLKQYFADLVEKE